MIFKTTIPILIASILNLILLVKAQDLSLSENEPLMTRFFLSPSHSPTLGYHAYPDKFIPKHLRSFINRPAQVYDEYDIATFDDKFYLKSTKYQRLSPPTNFLDGAGHALWGSVVGMVELFKNPLQTAKDIGYAVRHLPLASRVVWENIKEHTREKGLSNTLGHATALVGVAAAPSVLEPYVANVWTALRGAAPSASTAASAASTASKVAVDAATKGGGIGQTLKSVGITTLSMADELAVVAQTLQMAAQASKSTSQTPTDTTFTPSEK